MFYRFQWPLFFLCLCLAGCASVFTKKLEKPHYWQASKDGTKVSILGTFHAFVSVDEVPPDIIQSLKTSQLLVLEVPPVVDTSNALMRLLARVDRGIVYSELSSKDFKFYKSLYKKSTFGRRLLAKDHHIEMDNYVLANLILLSFIEDQTEATIKAVNRGQLDVKKDFIGEINDLTRSLDYKAKMDVGLYEIAVEEDIVFDYLDRDIEPIIEIEKESSEVKFKQLFEVAKSIAADRRQALLFYHKKVSESVRLLELYRSGRPVLFDDYLNQILGQSLREKLLQQRNTMWAESFDSISKGYKTVFIGLGAAHLYGEGSFLKELEKQGYVISPGKTEKSY